jgi:fructose-1,6-bisphosphatase
MSRLSDQIIDTNLVLLLRHVLNACGNIGRGLRDCRFSSEGVGSVNKFGDNQLDVDVKTDAIIFEALRASGVVVVASSEESPTEVKIKEATEIPGNCFSVAFDPLDGSSIVGTNFAVGSIVGIWQGTGLLNRIGREQVSTSLLLLSYLSLALPGIELLIRGTVWPSHHCSNRYCGEALNRWSGPCNGAHLRR